MQTARPGLAGPSRLAPRVALLLSLLAPLTSLAAPARSQQPAGAASPAAPAPPCDRGPQLAQVPQGFVDELVVGGLEQAVGLLFTPDGRLLVWQRAGVVWQVQDGALLSPPVLDLREEVGAWGDHGLQGVALDPQFAENGRIYLNYVVDHYHLTHFGQPGYDPDASEPYVETIGRITRYTLAGEPLQADPASRYVLLGEDIAHGFPMCSASHGLGALAFGSDGTLLAACGDGQGGPPASGTALAEGIIQPKEDVGGFRAQLVDSLAGKIVRLDPLTGNGVPGNPFFDPAAPRAPRSRVWTLGLRNPYRFAVRPGSGASSPASADPGALFIGDVGGALQEELSIVDGRGANLGWPIWEGLQLQPDVGTVPTANLDAPNLLYNPALPGSGKPFFDFQDLLLPDGLPSGGGGGGSGAAFLMPAAVLTDAPQFVHQRPALAWTQQGEQTLVPVYDAAGNGVAVAVGAPGSPVAGAAFGGNCSMGGAFCTGSSYPSELQGAYFHADFGQGWIRVLQLDAAGGLLSVEPFAQSAGPVVAVASGAPDGSLHYINYGNAGVSEVRRIRHATDDLPPHAVIEASATFGPSPLPVLLDGSASTDPEGAPLQFHWDFGDGTPASAAAAPVHVFPSEDITALGTIVAKLFELSPPAPMGQGNPSAEVIRDGDWPPLDSSDPLRQFDTTHHQGFIPDKGPVDWLGYTFAQPRLLTGLVFQEGMHFSGWGGWWLAFVVQVRSDGVWKMVQPLYSQPVYPAQFYPYYETFEFQFLPLMGDGIRLYGLPDGLLDFFSVGELRALARPVAPLTGSATFTVTLTVTDNAGNSDSASLAIGLNNTPPQAQIAKPDNYDSYATAAPSTLTLRSVSSDAESSDADLQCTWQTIEHHDDHTHPGPLLPGCETSTVLGTEGADGDVHFVEVVLTVADPDGLATSVSRYLVPDVDLNLNGSIDAQEIAAGTCSDTNADGVPDEVQHDCNGNGSSDLYDTFFGTSADANADGLPDECQGIFPFQPR